MARERLPWVPAGGPGGKVVDEAVVARLVADVGAEPARQVCSVFLADAGERVGVLRAALEAADGDTARRAAHRLKSAAGFVGATALAARCAAVERVIVQGDVAAACSWSGALDDEFQATATELRRVLDGLASPRWSPATP